MPLDGLDLHLELSATRPGVALERALREAVRHGRLRPGTRLPAARSLAADLGVSRNTVLGVYGQLGAEGWLDTRVGAGTWVADRQATPDPRSTVAPPAVPRLSLDLLGGVPDPSDFPRGEWVAAVRSVSSTITTADLGYETEPRGHKALRHALASYLARTRGVAADSDHVLVASGFSELLSLTARALRAGGATRIGVERYGHPRHREILAAAGMTVVTVALDQEGVILDDVRGAALDAVLVTPAHQFPTGVAMGADRRRELLQWAREQNALVLEDDYDGEFRYDRRAIGAVQALDPDRVVYLGTASKALAPAAALGWAVASPAFRSRIVAQRVLSGARGSTLHELAMAMMLDGHQYDRHLRRSRLKYRARQRRLSELVESRHGRRLSGVAAGLHCLLHLESEATVGEVVRSAARLGVSLEPLASFAADERVADVPPAVVVGYGAVTDRQFDRALGVLDQVLTLVRVREE